MLFAHLLIDRNYFKWLERQVGRHTIGYGCMPALPLALKLLELLSLVNMYFVPKFYWLRLQIDAAVGCEQICNHILIG